MMRAGDRDEPAHRFVTAPNLHEPARREPAQLNPTMSTCVAPLASRNEHTARSTCSPIASREMEPSDGTMSMH